MIEIQSEFDTSEEMFLGDLIRGIRKGYINFKVEEVNVGYRTLPILILGEESSLDNFHGEWHIWLNPKEQHKYNYGWYTIEDLSDWLNDKGKIMKTIS